MHTATHTATVSDPLMSEIPARQRRSKWTRNPPTSDRQQPPAKAFTGTHPSHFPCSNGAAFRRAPVAPARGVSQSKACAAMVCGGRAS